MTDTTQAPRAKRMEPPVTPTTETFWEATRERRLILQWCPACNRAIFFPRDVCPSCLGPDLEWRPASGKGRVYSYTVEYRPQNPNLAAPYTVALIDLDEGVRVMSNLVNCPPEAAAVDLPVTVTWEELSDGRHLPMFEPAKGALR